MRKMKKNHIFMILSVLVLLVVFAVSVSAEVVLPTAKTGLVENGEKQTLIEAGKLTDGDEVDRYYRYKFESEDDVAYTKDANLIAAKDAGAYLVEWQLISTKDGDESILDAGLIKVSVEASSTKPNVNTGNAISNKLLIGIVAMFVAVIIILVAVIIEKRIGDK